ncbi:MAG TPA: class II fructose-bisphosphatase [Bacillota bacterium]|nr:class II fructose-bisphosphatase [Bacillota bacterium]HOH10556.1 class II fructose-bisphosphatase [Bacillota bacterium]HOS49851.1 class II fructose-bisphosphatase [Bacillota bacterium]HPI02032.1 class II fructose-bisphosphatase [Bacillota bacterium]HPM64042.1 class II fructose-bisphosphatase [Bacillota bacterium]
MGHDREREILLELVRVTETAALKAARFMGTGDKNAVDGAGVDGMRGMLDLVRINGTIIIGEGEKDKAPMLYNGEKVGLGGDEVEMDIAVDPIEGTSLVANGMPGAISVMVAADKGTLMPFPTFYAHKIAVGPEAKEGISLDEPVRVNLHVVAANLGKKVRDLTVVVLNRPRHEALIREIRECGARIKLIQDGDVAAAIATALPDTGVDMLMGIGGAPEAVITAAAMKCLGGEILTKLYAPDKDQKERAVNAGFKDLEETFCADDLAKGDGIVFSATGVTDGEMLRGVRFEGDKCMTESITMRYRTGTIRRIITTHDLSRKTIRGSSGQELRV